MNKTIIWLIVIIVVIAGIWWGVSRRPTEEEVIKIGFIGPLSGDEAKGGESELNAINLALEDLGWKINNKKVKIIAEDGKCNGKEAATAAQKLINVDKVKVILGGACSAETLGAAPITEANKVILFSAFSSNPQISEAGIYIFRNYPSDTLGGKKGAEMIKEKKVAIITENTDYSMGIREVFKKEFIKRGGKIVADEIYTPGEKDFRTYLIKIKSASPEAIFINPGTSPGTGGMIAKQAKELKFNLPLYGNFLLGTQDALEIGSEALEGAIFFDTPTLDLKNPKAKNFISRYKEKYGEPFNELEVGARYDSVFIIANAIKRCRENTDCIKNYLYAMPEYHGTIGTYRFDENGDPIGLTFIVKKIINGKPEAIEQK